MLQLAPYYVRSTITIPECFIGTYCSCVQEADSCMQESDSCVQEADSCVQRSWQLRAGGWQLCIYVEHILRQRVGGFWEEWERYWENSCEKTQEAEEDCYAGEYVLDNTVDFSFVWMLWLASCSCTPNLSTTAFTSYSVRSETKCIVHPKSLWTNV